ncbi:MAG: hypothetical protein BRD46_00360 [Bacteroidetes bacterium QS_8_68_15]|jgi:hypothetical protein|nr:MAG: hypothetical protein BRD46_00360 [Bacteroidetes bacterium QS_8_68_15]
MKSRLKDLRYSVMLALYLPILLYAFSTYDLSDDTYAVQSVEPVVVGDRTVVLGQPFTARTFLSVGRSEGKRLQTADGGVRAVGDSLLRMSTGGVLAEDEQEQTVSYGGQFSFQQVDGQTAQIPVRGQFTVRRPEIVATSEATQSLYRRCLNRIRIDVPGLEDRPLRLEYGSKSTAGRSIALSPGGSSSSTVRVFLADSASADTQNVLLGEKEFAVIDPPRPELRVRSGGREVTSGDNLSRRRAVLNFEVEPDAEFRQRYPQDAQYSVGRATVFLRKGLTASRKIGTFDLSDGRLVLTRQLSDAEAGDRITVRLGSVVRVNHAGQAIPVSFSEATRTFGFVLS